MQLIDTSTTQAELIRTESERIMEYFDSLSPENLEKPRAVDRRGSHRPLGVARRDLSGGDGKGAS